MVVKTSFETQVQVLTLRGLHFSYEKIRNKLLESDISVSLSTIIRIIKNDKRDRSSHPRSPRKFGNQNLPSARISSNIKKVASAIKKPNPPTQRAMAIKLGISQTSINTILKQDLGQKLRKKRRVHSLTENQMSQRLERAPRFLSYLGKYKTRNIFTMDETIITLNDVNVGRDCYYEGTEDTVPEDWKKLPRKSWPPHIMVAIGICWNGVSRAYIVPENRKVNADYFIQDILKPMIEEDIPRLYPGREKDVTWHMDSAPAHTAKKTYKWLDERGIKYIPKQDWMANSPDMAPLDYGINANFKRIISQRRVTTIDGLKKVIVEEWNKFSVETVRNVLSSWDKRVNLMVERQGSHVEHIL